MEEIWKQIIIKGVETQYEISNFGNVLSNKWNKKKRVSNHFRLGYLRVSISPVNNFRKTFSVHRLVAEAFIPNPNNYHEINHIDADKKNNISSNLEWCDRTHNVRHSFELGLNYGRFGGENPKAHKVTQYNNGVLIRIYDCIRDAKAFGFTEGTISQCARGLRKNHKGFQWQYAN